MTFQWQEQQYPLAIGITKNDVRSDLLTVLLHLRQHQ